MTKNKDQDDANTVGWQSLWMCVCALRYFEYVMAYHVNDAVYG